MCHLFDYQPPPPFSLFLPAHTFRFNRYYCVFLFQFVIFHLVSQVSDSLTPRLLFWSVLNFNAYINLKSLHVVRYLVHGNITFRSPLLNKLTSAEINTLWMGHTLIVQFHNVIFFPLCGDRRHSCLPLLCVCICVGCLPRETHQKGAPLIAIIEIFLLERPERSFFPLPFFTLWSRARGRGQPTRGIPFSFPLCIEAKPTLFGLLLLRRQDI